MDKHLVLWTRAPRFRAAPCNSTSRPLSSQLASPAPGLGFLKPKGIIFDLSSAPLLLTRSTPIFFSWFWFCVCVCVLPPRDSTMPWLCRLVLL